MFTQILSHLNWLHIIVAAVAFFVLGALWYSPVLFAKPWARMTNMNANDPNVKKGMGVMMLSSFILMIICCIALAMLYQIIQIKSAVAAIKFGLFFGVGFALTAISISFVYERKPLGLYAIDIGYQIAGIIIASLVLVLWK
ncbi:MAG TPA: DUF1761 domain-containing protein [Chitinophagaceae bacterium]|nr:DUF1761 domain-containing protein [Chitinophagaceae bacterium]